MHAPAAQNTSRFDKYVSALVEARKKKGISREVASDQVRLNGAWLAGQSVTVCGSL